MRVRQSEKFKHDKQKNTMGISERLEEPERSEKSERSGRIEESFNSEILDKSVCENQENPQNVKNKNRTIRVFEIF